jgi:polyisoprenoid-binding protein YceI
MKKNNFLKVGFATLIAFVSIAFTSTINKEVNIKESKIKWKGYKVTGEHFGTINLQKGILFFDGNKLTGGDITIDMNSIKVTDIQGEYASKLEGHLKNDDFFGVNKYPTAKLKFTDVKVKGNTNHITADMTIKGITSPVKFEMNINGDSASAKLKIDRTKYGIKYGSASFFDDLKDKAILDDFDIDVLIKF